ncbi:hypothetical protein NQ176_g1425 [Zarea fungicola]|uniref:Uncharacterized protein n=1 Tax=Zarea fungicola TaxID=93591 RepID=A0ACC1NSV7_9HYPO|nr:hypothetical protein NQ176_g1425 [Lecanicillium fungicola]
MSSSRQPAVQALWQQVDDVLAKYLPLTAGGTLSKARGEINKLFIDYGRASGLGGPGSSLLERLPLSTQPLHRASAASQVATMSSATLKPFSLFGKNATAPQNSLASQRREEHLSRPSAMFAVETNNSRKQSLKHQSTSQDEDGDEYMEDEGDECMEDEGDDGYGDSESDDDDDYDMVDKTYIDEVGDLSDGGSIGNGNEIHSCVACLEDRSVTDLVKVPCAFSLSEHFRRAAVVFSLNTPLYAIFSNQMSLLPLLQKGYAWQHRHCSTVTRLTATEPCDTTVATHPSRHCNVPFALVAAVPNFAIDVVGTGHFTEMPVILSALAECE